MSCCAPLSKNLLSFWQHIMFGKECLTQLASDNKQKRHSQRYVPVAGVLPDYKSFDYDFFGISYDEARRIDPQHRLMLEVAYDAIENSGYSATRHEENIGVYIGARNSTYVESNLNRNHAHREFYSQYDDRLLTSPEFIATRIAYYLNLKGPSLTLQTACSSSLVSVAEACQSLLEYDCNMAVAGGVSFTTPHEYGYWYQEGFIYSKQGKCCPFDEKADGTILTGGVGAVVLKRLDDAINDGDTIYSTINGYNVNNDGGSKAGYAVPSKAGQKACIQSAIEYGHIDVEKIHYIEAHGTGTYVGDPVEFLALSEAFRTYTSKKSYCYLGSLKANMGHADAAAGILGLIKTALITYYQKIPPQINYQSPNKQFDLPNSPFLINGEDGILAADVKYAGVSSLGIGGTNAHIILEAYTKTNAQKKTTEFPAVIPLSNMTEKGLMASAEALSGYLHSSLPDDYVTNIAYSYQCRRAFNCRMALIANNKNQLSMQLEKKHPMSPQQPCGPVIFLFSGQSALRPEVGKQLFETTKELRSLFLACCDAAMKHAIDLKPFFTKDNEDEKLITKTLKSQSVAFTIQYVLGMFLQQIGINPSISAGHSLGELVAAAVNQHISLSDCYAIISKRTELFERYGKGAMILVPLSTEELANISLPDLSIAAINSANHTMLSGEKANIDKAKSILEQHLCDNGKKKDIVYFSKDYAFHSALLDQGKDDFLQFLQTITLNTLSAPLFSTCRIEQFDAEHDLDPNYWFEQMRSPVLFSEAITALSHSHSNALFIDLSPDARLRLALLYNGIPESHIISVLQEQAQSNESFSLLHTIASCWERGIDIKWSLLREHTHLSLLLPTYAFQKTVCWIDPNSEETTKKTAPFYIYRPRWIQELDRSHENRLKEAHSVPTLLFFDSEQYLAKQHKDIKKLWDPALLTTTLKGVEDFINNEKKELILLIWASPSADTLSSAKFYIDFFHKIFSLFEKNKAISCSCFFIVPSADAGSMDVDKNPYGALFRGLTLTIPNEAMSVKTRLIHYTDDGLDILSRVKSLTGQPIVDSKAHYIIDQTAIWKLEYAQLSIPHDQKNQLDEGTYIIIGGGGAIGLALANFIAENVASHIILVGRHLDASNPDIEALRSTAKKLTLLKADVSKKKALHDAIQSVVLKDETIEMVIHAAGIAGGALIGAKSQGEFARVCDPKIQGTQHVLSLLSHHRIKKILLFSSITAHIGGVGQLAYATANAALEALAEQTHCRDTKIQTIAWDVWRGLGMSAALLNDHHAQSSNFLTLQNGLDAFNLAIATDMPTLIVSGIHWTERCRYDYVETARCDKDEPDADEIDMSTLDLPSIIKGLTDLWTETFSREKFDKTLFLCQLGGDSLTGLQLLHKVNRKYHTQIDFNVFLENSSVEQLARILYKETREAQVL